MGCKWARSQNIILYRRSILISRDELRGAGVCV